jgi:cytochrome c
MLHLGSRYLVISWAKFLEEGLLGSVEHPREVAFRHEERAESAAREGTRMNSAKILVVFVLALAVVSLASDAIGQDKATPQEVVAKVRKAASTLSKAGDLSQFMQKQGPWVWKDTYVFVDDCDKKVVVAHPVNPERVGQALASIKDSEGKALYPDVEAFCHAAQKPSGTWIEYSYPKPGEKQGSRKISYYLSAPGTPYVVGAGVYDDGASIDELRKLTSK